MSDYITLLFPSGVETFFWPCVLDDSTHPLGRGVSFETPSFVEFSPLSAQAIRCRPWNNYGKNWKHSCLEMPTHQPLRTIEKWTYLLLFLLCILPQFWIILIWILRKVYLGSHFFGNPSIESLSHVLSQFQIDIEEFFNEFVACLKRFLIVFKREPAVERAIDFICKFSASLCTQNKPEQEGEKEEKEAKEDDQDMHPFLLKLFQVLLQVVFCFFCYRSVELETSYYCLNLSWPRAGRYLFH